MKKSFLFKVVRGAGILMALFAIVAAVFGSPETALSIGGTSLAMAIPGGVTTTNTAAASSDLLLNDIDQKIIEIAPDRAPLDTYIRTIPDRKVSKSLKYEYYSVDYKAVKDTVAVQPTISGQQNISLQVTNIDLWAENDTVFIAGINAYDADNTVMSNQDLACFVYGIDRENSLLKIQPINGYRSSSIPTFKSGDDIAVSTVLRRGGRAGQEEDIQTTPYQDMPEKDYNFMQKFMAQVEITTWAEDHNKEVQWGFADHSRRQLTNMRIEKEMSYINGIRGIISSKKNGKDVYLTGGAKDFVTGLSDWTSETLANKLFQKFTRECFEGNAGSDQRIFFVGDLLMQQLGEIDDVQAQTRNKKRETEYGLTFNRINTNFGELLIVKHPLFGLQGMGNMGLVLDPMHLGERIFEPTRMIDLDLQKSGQKDAMAKVIIQTSCPVFKYPATHRWVKGKTS